jgi:lipid-A-disaccharide synthase
MRKGMTARRILMTAGEASADRHASRVIRELKSLLPGVEIFGMGGPEMASAGMECTFSMDELSVMGITDVIPKLRSIRKIHNGLKLLMETRKPDLFIPVDLPDFNMGLASFAKTHGFRVLYYIAPQAWAWRQSRAKTLSRITDGLAVIFPFEAGFFLAHRVNTRYVGHPFMEEGIDNTAYQASWPPKKAAILPGSRNHEITRMLPVMMAAKRRIQEIHPEISWRLPVAPGLDEDAIRSMLDEDVQIVHEIPEADLAMVKSGTSSLEMAIRGVPEVICYKTSPVNFLLAKAFVRIKNIGMPNIIAGKTIVPELIQHYLTPEDLARTLRLYIEDRALYEATQISFTRMKESLGTLHASHEVAAWAMELLERT